MSIIYTLVSRANEKILCEYTDYRGNFEQIARLLLKKTSKCDKASISYDEKYLFHYTTENKITFMAMCDSTYSVETAFEFIEVIKDLFMRAFSQEEINIAYAYSFNQKFKDTLKQKMDYYNLNSVSSSINQIEVLKNNIAQTTNILIDSSQVLGDRSEKINLIVKKADLLRSDSISFFDNAVKIKERSRRKKIRIFMTITFILLILSYIIAAVFCGWSFDCLKEENIAIQPKEPESEK